MRVKIYDGKKPRFIGDYTDNIFTKHVKRSRHLMKKLRAWGIDGHYFTTVLKPNNASITVVDDETGITYRTDALTMDKQGIWRTYPPHGHQIFLALHYWYEHKNL